MSYLKKLIDYFKQVFTTSNCQNMTAEQIDALNKRTIVLTFCFALMLCIVTVCYCVSYVENPLEHIAKADQYNYETIKITITQIFSALSIILGAKAMTPYTPPIQQPPIQTPAPQPPTLTTVIQPVHKKLGDDDA